MTKFISELVASVGWIAPALPAVLLIFLRPFLDAMETTGELDKNLGRCFIISLLAGVIALIFIFFVLDQSGLDTLRGLWIVACLIWSVEGATKITACLA